VRTDEEIQKDYIEFRGRCKELSEKAVAADPSLTLVRGYYFCPIWCIEEQHWWADGYWRCTVPRNDFATQRGFSWRKYGVIGHGKTPRLAFMDWQAFRRTADLVNDIY
jgi:hypothetical protein